MPQLTDIFSLGRLGLTSGEGRRFELHTRLAPLELAGERYAPDPDVVPVRLEVSRTTGAGFALRLRFAASLTGPCMRCLGPSSPGFEIDAREVNQPAAGDEDMRSPYVDAEDDLDLSAWARDAFALALPGQIACTPECRGLCPRCGADLNAEPEHAHEAEPDPRWSKLSEIRFD